MIQVWDGDGLERLSDLVVDLSIPESIDLDLQDAAVDSPTTMDLHLHKNHPTLEHLFVGAMFDLLVVTWTTGGKRCLLKLTDARVVSNDDEPPVCRYLRLSFAKHESWV